MVYQTLPHGRDDALTTVQLLSANIWIGGLAVAGAFSAAAVAVLDRHVNVADIGPGLVLGFLAIVSIESVHIWGTKQIFPDLRTSKWLAYTLAVGIPFPVLIMWSFRYPWPVTLLFSLVFGFFGGTAGGMVQARLLRAYVPHPNRWVIANGLAWGLALSIVLPPISAMGDVPWATPIAALLGALGAAIVGLVEFMLASSVAVQGPRAPTRRERIISDVLRGPAHRLISSELTELRYFERTTGVVASAPVSHAQLDRYGSQRTEILFVTAPATREWFRSVGDGAQVSVVLDGTLWTGVATRIPRRDPQFKLIWAAYLEARPRSTLGVFDCLLVVELTEAGTSAKYG